MVAVVPAMLLQLAFTVGPGLLLGTAYVYARDTRHLLEVAVQLVLADAGRLCAGDDSARVAAVLTLNLMAHSSPSTMPPASKARGAAALAGAGGTAAVVA